MQLKDIAQDLPVPADCEDLEILGVTADSRAVKPGFLFTALKGARVDGTRFIAQAVEAGAVAVLVGADADPSAVDAAAGRAVLTSEDPRRHLALMAARLAGAQPETMVAVTGTSGKTSVAVFARQIFAAAGFEAASLGTIGTVTSRGESYGGLTTPDPVALHADLARLAAEGITHAAMEASSHGLDQRRLDGVRLKAAAFTNLGRDHLDYHPDVESYMAAKLRLFDTLLPEDGAVVVEPSAPAADRVLDVASERGLRTITVGEGGKDLALTGIEHDGFIQILSLETPHGPREVRLPLAGRFQASNALVAAGLALAVGTPLEAVLTALEELKGAPGRLELVGTKRNGALVFVDYSHKPDALDNALSALRPLTAGRLVVVFGAGGDRDPGKRPLMGKAAAERADVIIVTDDNPRGEDPAAIRRAVLEGAPDALEIGDRGEAIAEAVRMLGPGDVLCIAGKGHETGQIIGDEVLPFSDHEAARSALEDDTVLEEELLFDASKGADEGAPRDEDPLKAGEPEKAGPDKVEATDTSAAETEAVADNVARDPAAVPRWTIEELLEAADAPGEAEPDAESEDGLFDAATSEDGGRDEAAEERDDKATEKDFAVEAGPVMDLAADPPTGTEALWTMDDLVAAAGGRIVGNPAAEVTGISIDSRTLEPGEVFFAIRGDRFDGHDFAKAAIERGAAAAVVAEDKLAALDPAGPYVVVPDPLEALYGVAEAARSRSTARIVAVTGSVGKTGTKEMLRLALSRSGRTHASVASFNNHWGVPLTLARMPRDTEFGVFEIGMNHAGEITPLTKLVRPHVAIITTVQPVHLEYFGSVERIAQAKAEIFAGLEPDGVAILNRDNDQFDLLCFLAKAAGVQRILTFGSDGPADAQALKIAPQTGCTSISARVGGEEIAYKVGAPGRHLVRNSLAVLMAVADLGADLALAGLALAELRAPVGRGAQTILKLPNGRLTLIDESYNANPASMRAALTLLADTPVTRPGRRIAVIGDMRELGEAADKLHAALAEPVEEADLDLVYCVGPHMHALWKLLPTHRRGAYSEDSQGLRPLLLEDVRPGDVVMIKGSLGTRMGPLVEALKQEFPAVDEAAE